MQYEDYKLFSFINHYLAVDTFIYYKYEYNNDLCESYESCEFMTSAYYIFIIDYYYISNSCSLTVYYKNKDKLKLYKDNITLSQLNFILDEL